jgi:AraC family transcriptional regulator of arabinose operon
MAATARLRVRDGFSGQHMLVLPSPLGAEARRHPLLTGLFVTDAGYFPSARNHHVDRPGGSPTTVVILCLKGEGWVRSAGAAQPVAAGDLVWLPADEPHAYGSGTKKPWTILWAHFSGSEVASWEVLMGLSGKGRPMMLSLPDDRLEELALDRVYAALERGFALRHLVAAAAALRHSLSCADQLGKDSRDPRSADERVAKSIESLRADWQRPHRLRELATAARVSVAHYSSIFRRQTGFSPIDFIIRLRIRHACRLLDTTLIPIGEIGRRTGYEDPYYFARSFRRVMGFSPRRYRQGPPLGNMAPPID